MSSQPNKTKKKSCSNIYMSNKIKDTYFKVPLKIISNVNNETYYKYQKQPDTLGKEFREDNDNGFNNVWFTNEFQRKKTDYNTIIRYTEKENLQTGKIEKKPIYLKYLGEPKFTLKKNEGYSVLTGGKNKLSVIDLDIKDWTIDNKFIKYCCEKLDLEIKENVKDTVINIVNKIDTYTVKSPNGFHLYFHNKNGQNISNSANSKENVDIRGEGGLIIGAYTQLKKPNGSIVEYKPYIDKELVDITDKTNIDIIDLFDEIKSWSNNNKRNIDKTNRIKKYKNRPLDDKLYDYLFTDKQLDKLESLLPDKYFIDLIEWKKLTMFYATINRKDRWDKICYEKRFISGVDKYNKNNNEYHYNLAFKDKDRYTMVEHILKACGLMKDLPYHKIKKIPENVIKPDDTFDKERVSDYFYEDTVKGIYNSVFEKNELEGQNLVIKSGTATGKSYFFKYYHSVKLDRQTPIMSIVSRVSLAEEHNRIFTQYNNDLYSPCEEEDGILISNPNNEDRNDTVGEIKKYKNRQYALYTEQKNLWCGGLDLIIQVDSLMRLKDWDTYDFQQYCIFIDEFNSVFEYLMLSDTLKNKRRQVFKLFSRILKNAKQVIMCDADITDTALMYLNMKYWEICGLKLTEEEKQTYSLICPNIEFKYIENKHKHYKGVESEELFNYELLVEQLSKLDKFMVCCDSKNESLNLKVKLVEKGVEKDNIIVICGATDIKDKDLDKYKQVIFSPSIVYGLDSQMKREVYCIMTEKSITSRGMLQQVARCRNITKLWYYFPYKKLELAKGFTFNNQEEVINRVISLDNYSTNRFKEIIKEVILSENMNFEDLCNEYDILNNTNGICNSFFMNLLNRIIYYDDCDSSNKFLHFKLGLRKLGYDDKELMKDLQDRDRAEQKALKNLVKEQIREMFIHNLNSENVNELNKILKLPTDEDKIEYFEIFCETGAFDKHIAFCNLYLEDCNNVSLKLNDSYETEFGSHLCKSTLNKVNYLRKLFKKIELDIELDLLGEIELTENEANKFYTEYNLIWKNRKSKKDNPFLNKYDLSKFIKDAIKDLVGFSPYTAKEIKVYIEDKITKQKKRVSKTDYTLNKLSGEFEYHTKLKDFRNIENLDNQVFHIED